MTVTIGELMARVDATPAHRLFGVHGRVVENRYPSTHEMLVHPRLLDGGELDLGVLGMVADPSSAGAAANLCDEGSLPVTRALRLERLVTPTRSLSAVVAIAEGAWRSAEASLTVRGVVRDGDGTDLALMTFHGTAIPAVAHRSGESIAVAPTGRAPFEIGQLTQGGLPWRAELWAGPECGQLSGGLHGGVSFLLASRFATRLHRTTTSRRVELLDVDVQYVRPIRAGTLITATGGVVRETRRFSRVEGSFYVEGRTALTFTSTATRSAEDAR